MEELHTPWCKTGKNRKTVTKTRRAISVMKKCTHNTLGVSCPPDSYSYPGFQFVLFVQFPYLAMPKLLLSLDLFDLDVAFASSQQRRHGSCSTLMRFVAVPRKQGKPAHRIFSKCHSCRHTTV